MRFLVIYPGRFHLFHLGHKFVYDYLVKQWTPLGGSVYIATTEKQQAGTSPFTYSDKVAMLTKMGVPASHILKVVNPYAITDYVNDLPDADDTVLVFALGAKDQQLVRDANGKVTQRPRFEFKPKKDGTPSATQPLPDDLGQCRPVSEGVAYVEVVDTQEFKVAGQSVTSASQVRKMYVDGNQHDREQIITDLYGDPDPELQEIFDLRLGVDDPQDIVTYGQEQIYTGDNPVNVMKERRELLARRITLLQEQIRYFRRTRLNEQRQDYIDERRPRKK